MTNEIIKIDSTALQTPETLAKVLDDIRNNNKRLRNSKTAKKDIKVRKGKKDKMFKYVNRITAMKWLDQNYPLWSWEFDYSSISEKWGYIVGVGKLTVLDKNGATRTISTVGEQEIMFERDSNKPVIKSYAKGVDTDSLKRAVFTLGGFSDVYTEDEVTDEGLPSDIEYIITEVISEAFKRISEDKYDIPKLQKMLREFFKNNISIEQIKSHFMEK